MEAIKKQINEIVENYFRVCGIKYKITDMGDDFDTMDVDDCSIFLPVRKYRLEVWKVNKNKTKNYLFVTYLHFYKYDGKYAVDGIWCDKFPRISKEDLYRFFYRILSRKFEYSLSVEEISDAINFISVSYLFEKRSYLKNYFQIKEEMSCLHSIFDLKTYEKLQELSDLLLAKDSESKSIEIGVE